MYKYIKYIKYITPLSVKNKLENLDICLFLYMPIFIEKLSIF
jgi:hypothetical protein